jgi:biotin operon repressor
MRYERSLAVTKRLDDILALIKCGAYSSPTLAEKLGVSEQTVYRDIVCLKRQGHQIRSVKRSANWAYQLLREAAEVHHNRGGRRT